MELEFTQLIVSAVIATILTIVGITPVAWSNITNKSELKEQKKDRVNDGRSFARTVEELVTEITILKQQHLVSLGEMNLLRERYSELSDKFNIVSLENAGLLALNKDQAQRLSEMAELKKRVTELELTVGYMSGKNEKLKSKNNELNTAMTTLTAENNIMKGLIGEIKTAKSSES